MIRLPKAARQEALAWYIKLSRPDLEQAEHQRFFEWLKSSEANQAAFIEVERAWQNGTCLQVESPSLLSRLFAHWEYGVGVSLACCLIVALAFSWSPNDSLMEPMRGQVGGLALKHTADGSQVVLASNAVGSYHLKKGIRAFELERGIAYFDVEKNPDAPFVVTTPYGSVKVLGTSFSIDITRGEAVVIVEEGSVALYDKAVSANQINEASPVSVLKANQLLSIQDAATGLTAASISASNALAWRYQKLVLNGEPLKEVVAQINRLIGVEISVVDDSLKDIRVVGVVSVQSGSDAVSALASLTAANVEGDGTSYRMYKDEVK